MSATRAILVCVLGAVTVACTAITGADDLSIEEKGQAVGQAEPEQTGSRVGRPSGSGANDAGAGSSGSSGTPTPSAPTNEKPPPPPPPPPDSGTTPPKTTSIACGQLTCAGATPVCCAALGSYTCVASGTACVGNRYRLACDSTEDCGTGEVCCAHFGANEGSRCTAAGNCKGPTASYARMCTSNGQCAAGQACAGFIIDPVGERLDLAAGLCID